MNQPKISLIVAMSQNRVVGKSNRVPWRIPKDLQRLKVKSIEHVSIIGRKTYDSMLDYYRQSGRPVPGKLYIIVTTDKNYKPDLGNYLVAHSLEEAIELAKQHEAEEVLVLGGNQIFRQTLPLANKLYLTIVKGTFEGDTFFPDYSEFKKVVSEEEGEQNGFKYKFLVLEK